MPEREPSITIAKQVYDAWVDAHPGAVVWHDLAQSRQLLYTVLVDAGRAAALAEVPRDA